MRAVKQNMMLANALIVLVICVSDLLLYALQLKTTHIFHPKYTSMCISGLQIKQTYFKQTPLTHLGGLGQVWASKKMSSRLFISKNTHANFYLRYNFYKMHSTPLNVESIA